MSHSGIFSKARGRLSMAFADRNKEERFLSQQRDNTAEQLRWACAVGAAIMIGFIWQDTLISATGYKAIIIRIFGALPVSALAWYLSRNMGVRRFISYISAFFWLIYACLTAALFTSYGPGPYGLTSSIGLGSFLIIIFGIFTFSNLRLCASILVGLSTLLVYTFSVALWSEAVFADFIMGDLLTAVALMTGTAIKTVFTERAQRRQFETSELLHQSYTMVEQQVRERTSELQVTNMQLADEIAERKLAEDEKRNIEERMQRSEKMEALGLLAGGVAHDLNNVLGIVVGYAELLLLKESKSSAIRPKLVEIMNGGQKAAAIVDDLLTMARRGVPGTNILNLNSIISDFQKSPEFKQLYSFHSSVQIKTELEHDLPNISGSSVHLGKTIFNLVSNASEAMKKGGALTIKTTNQYLDKPIHGYDEIQDGDYVVLSVSDTGEGISEADLKRIFEPFYTKKVMGRSGTGLGLAVVWGTVKDHNGYINVQSEEGKGSTFILYFPVTREKLSVDHVALPISEYMGKGESILIVDDVKGQQALATLMLKELNYSVTSVSSGEEALAYLKEHKADLMVLDMIMDPGMDGLDTYRSVLEIRPEQKAIIVSGFSESDRVKAAKALGAGAYVRKPYVIEKLGLAVKKELDRVT